MSPSPSPVHLPDSYTTLPFTQIRTSHVPADSPTPTPVILLTLYRPEKHNAFTPTMMHELEQAFTLVDLDPRVKCIVVTGHGRMFCAGADLDTGFVGGDETNREHRDGGGRVVLAIHRCRKPTVAAVQGSAVGVGITMTLPMNIRVGWEGAKVGFVFARRGLVMEAASSFFLPRLIGYVSLSPRSSSILLFFCEHSELTSHSTSKALHLTTTGSIYPANHPLLSSLFTETCAQPQDVLPRALALASDIAKNTSTVSTYLMKELMYRNSGSPEGTHLLDSSILFELFQSRDNKEGVRSFMEKREADFKGTMDEDAPRAYPWWEPVDVGNRSKGKGVGGAKL